MLVMCRGNSDCDDLQKGGPALTERHLVEHTLGPLYDSNSRVLILGTMPSPLSRANEMYYGNPRNRFWRVLAALFGDPVPATNDERQALALRHGIALWDVLASCTIEGASDSSIRDEVPNDVPWLLSQAPIASLFTTGSTAWRLYRRLLESKTGIAATRLPSPSPANASWSLPRLIEAWQPLRTACEQRPSDDSE